MSIEQALFNHLSDSTAVTNIVSTRIYHNHAPQSVTTYPMLVISLISNVHGHTLTAATGESSARIQIDSWSDTLSGAITLASVIKTALQGFIGTMDSTQDVAFVQLLNEQNLSEAPSNASDAWLYRKSQDFQFHLN